MEIFYSISRLAMTVAVAALIYARAAQGDIIYTVTATGIIDNGGQDYGEFGNAYGSDLTGLFFTVVENFDVTTSIFNQGDQNEDLNPATAGAVVTVDGISVPTNTSGVQNVLYLDSSVHSYGPGGSSPVYTAIGGPDFYIQLQVFNQNQQIIFPLTWVGLDTSYNITFTNTVTGTAYFQAADNSYFYGSLLTLELTAPAERIALAHEVGVPEPSSSLLFMSGFLLLVWNRRHAATRSARERRLNPAADIA